MQSIEYNQIYKMMEPPSSCHNLLSPLVTRKRKFATNRNAILSTECPIRRKRPRTAVTTTETTPNRDGKRVRFDSKEEIVELIRPSSEMTTEERSAAWYHKSDFRAALQAARLIGQATTFCTESELYVDTLANTYALCCVTNNVHTNGSNNGDSTDGDSDVLDQVAEQLAVVAAATGDEGCHRGLERMTVPLIGLEIVRRRKLAIASVVLAQKSLGGYLPRNKAEQSELLRMLSENETKPARKFAKAMGVVDAMGALVEYQQLQDI